MTCLTPSFSPQPRASLHSKNSRMMQSAQSQRGFIFVVGHAPGAVIRAAVWHGEVEGHTILYYFWETRPGLINFWRFGFYVWKVSQMNRSIEVPDEHASSCDCSVLLPINKNVQEIAIVLLVFCINKLGKSYFQLFKFIKWDYTALSDITDKTLEGVVNEWRGSRAHKQFDYKPEVHLSGMNANWINSVPLMN